VLAGQEARLAALVAARPDATLTELRRALATSAGLSTIWRALDRLQLTVKESSTPTSDDGLTSSRPGGSGTRGCRSVTCATTCSSMNVA
jgi:hypothetical protein